MKLKHPVLACLVLLMCHGAAHGADASGDTAAREDERAGGEWLGIGGHADLDSVHRRPENQDGYSNTGISEVGLSLAATVTDWLAVEAGFLYEHTDLGDRENVPGSEATFLETATLRFGPPEGPWSVSAGQQFLPFGFFDTRMFSEPLTLELGETNEIAVSLGWSSGGLTTTLFGFGRNDDLEAANGVAGYGAAVSYSSEREETGLALNLALTSDLSYSANVLGVLADSTANEGPADRIAGLSAHAALRYQATREALALELPARRLIAIVSLQLADPFTLAVEWGRDNDYSAGEGGSGEGANFVTVQFSLAF